MSTSETNISKKDKCTFRDYLRQDMTKIKRYNRKKGKGEDIGEEESKQSQSLIPIEKQEDIPIEVYKDEVKKSLNEIYGILKEVKNRYPLVSEKL